MKTILALALARAAARHGADRRPTSVSIGINQPGVYGRLTIGDVPAPALCRAEPVLVAPPRVVVEQQPVYLYVPPTHQQNWRRYCGRYRACGQPVYFVRDEWVRERWAHEHPGSPGPPSRLGQAPTSPQPRRLTSKSMRKHAQASTWPRRADHAPTQGRAHR